MNQNTSHRVLVVDDTALYRVLVSQAIEAIDGYEVVGQAENGAVALEKIRSLKPDIVLLDIEMPVMDGLQLLDSVRLRHPQIKCMVISSVSVKGGAITLDALQRGAVDFITKPETQDSASSRRVLIRELQQKLPGLVAARRRSDHQRASSSASNATSKRVYGSTPSSGSSAPAVALPDVGTSIEGAIRQVSQQRIDAIVIGISTGGPAALNTLMPRLSERSAPILIVQHMPGPFLTAMAEKLNIICPLTVVEATDGQAMLDSHVYIAPGGMQMGLNTRAGGAEIKLRADPAENHCLPSASYLMRSAAEILGRRALGIIMTGMGNDGTDGLLAMRQAGAVTAAQNEATCTVFGMPKQAIHEGAAAHVLSLEDIPRLINASRGHG